MFYKEKGFYISLICGIVCLVAFGAICMNVFSDSGKDQGNGLSKYCSAAKYRLVPIPLTESSTLGALTGFGADYWQNPGWE